MRRHQEAVQSLEPRRLMADLSMEIDDLRSYAAGHVTLNGQQLAVSPNGFNTSTFRGSLAVSDTKKGFRVLAADIEFVRETGGASFAFQQEDGAPDVGVAGPSIIIRSSRIAAPQGKFSTRRLSVEYDDGDVTVDDAGVVADLTGAMTTMDYAIGRVKRSDSAVVLTIPFRYSVRSTYTLNGAAQTLDFMMDGKIVAVADLASGNSLALASLRGSARPARQSNIAADVFAISGAM